MCDEHARLQSVLPPSLCQACQRVPPDLGRIMCRPCVDRRFRRDNHAARRSAAAEIRRKQRRIAAGGDRESEW